MTMTRAPRRASSVAVADPIAPVAPVTTTVGCSAITRVVSVAGPAGGKLRSVKPLISAHRGGEVVAGETAKERYRRAIGMGVDFVELDVRKTRDGVCVIYHDDCTASGRAIKEFAYSELTGELAGEALTYEELLDVAAGRVGLHIDLKETGYETEVVNLALEAGPIEKLVITGGDDTVRNVKDQFPQVRSGLSLGDDLKRVSPWLSPGVRLSELFPGRRVKRSHADFVAVHHQLAELNVLRWSDRRGIEAWVWTVDKERDIARFVKDSRVTTLVTNRPAAALQLRS
jgi:glycerophosphoryl diester phosphodiesterase